MTRERGRLRATLVLLLLVSAALFAVGATVERHQHTEAARTAASETSGTTEGSSPSTETHPSESGGETQPSETHPASGETASTSSEKLFGINPEATWLVVLGVAVSALLALAVWFADKRSLLILVGVFGLLLAALDIRELVHQIHESRASLVVVSAVLAMLHLAVAGIAALVLRQRMATRVTA
jgi:4-hydroxybenzoate polyprenyltransferase